MRSFKVLPSKADSAKVLAGFGGEESKSDATVEVSHQGSRTSLQVKAERDRRM